MLFISYARKDKASVVPLVSILAVRKVEVWIDQSDIPFTADFVLEIERAITGAQAIVFMLSPRSCDSQMCQMELATAAALGKRIIPVQVAPLDSDGQCPEILRKLNWIPGRMDRIEDVATAIQAAVDFDHAHLVEHTWIVTRAREWEKTGKPNSTLLRGQELARADRWVASARSRDPEPTALQLDYLRCSRRKARNDRILGWVMAFAFLATAIGGIAYYRYFSRSETLRSVATTAAKIETLLDGPDQAEALTAALDNAQVSYGLVGRIEPSARSALMKSLERSREVKRWIAEDRVVDARLASTGKRVLLYKRGEAIKAGETFGAIVDSDDQGRKVKLISDRPIETAQLCHSGACIALWSVDSIQIRMTDSGDDLALPIDAARASSVDFDVRASRIVVGTLDGDVLLIRRGDMSVEKRFSRLGLPVRGVSIVPGTDWIFVHFERGTAVFLNATTERMDNLGNVGTGPMSSYVLLPMGPQVLHPGAPGQIERIVAGSSHAEVWANAGNQRISELAADPNGRLIAATSDTEGFVYLFDSNGDKYGKGPVFGGIRPHVVFDASGEHILVASEFDGTFRLVRTSDALAPKSLKTKSAVRELTACAKTNMVVWSEEDGSLGSFVIGDTPTSVYWNPGLGPISSLACNKAGEVIASFPERGARLFDLTSRAVLASWPSSGGPSYDAIATDEAGGLYAATDGKLVELQRTGGVRLIASIQVNPVSVIAIDKGGDRFAVGSSGPGNVQIGRLDDGATIAATFTAHRGQVMGIAWGGEQAPLISAGTFGGEGRSTLSVWNAKGQRVRGVQAAPTMTTSLSLDPKLGLIATAGGDGHIRLWSLDLVEVGYRLQSHPGGLARVSFAAEGRLVTGGADAEIRIYDLSDKYLLQVARAKLPMPSREQRAR